MSQSAARLLITGRVQGVGFRAWLRREARRRSLRGWVRNLRDGSVEALVIGDDVAIEGLIEASRRGPSLAQVDDVRRDSATDDGSPDFTERPTF